MESGVVALWTWSLAEREHAQPLDELLSADENARADRFHFAEHRRRFLAARAGLRVLLGGVTGAPPAEIAFDYAEFGKPKLAGMTGVGFNLSHTGDIALAAITAGDEVGVDIEAHRPCEQAEAIAERHFSPAEAAAYRKSSASDQTERFFNLWTAKEAVIKLLGSGLRFPLTSFETPESKASAGAIALPTENPLAIQNCWLEPIVGFPGCSAAVACVSRPRQIVARRLDVALS